MLNPIEGAISVMNRLRYRPKLALIGFLFLMPLGLVTTFFISEIDSKVSQVESEATGLKYEQAVQSLLIATAQRQNSILLNYPVSVPSSEAELRFHTALTQLGDPNRSSQTIDSAGRYQAALLAVGRLKEGGTTNLSNTMSDHSEALRAITELGNEVADRSELVLDVNYDTYYLMDSSLTNAPQIIQSAAADEVLIFDEIAKPDTGKKGRNARLLLEGRIRDATDRLSRDVDRTSHYNPVYGSRLKSPLSRLRQKVSAFSAWSDNAKAPHDPTGQNRKRDLQQTSNIVAATDAFQRVALENLGILLEQRKNNLTNRRVLVLSVDAGFVAIALLAFAGFYGSTTRTVRQLVTAGIDVQAHCRLVRSAASGSTISDSVVPSDTPIKLHTYDELRELGLMMLQLCTDLGQSAEEYARSQDAMRSARDEAEAANRTKTDFLSRTSHELRTPLNSIMGFAQVLDLQDLSQRQKDSVGLILRSGKHLLAMIDEILDLARIENRDMSISVEPVPVGSMLRDAMALVGPLAKEKEVQIDCEVVSEDLCVQSDRKRLLQVLLNLLANAIKYNVVPGFVSLKLVTGDGRVQIEIADTGVGIAEDQLDQLFFPFARLGKEMGEIEGSGLGLALSRGLVETMNGTLTYRPNKPVGSVFVVNLPFAVSPVATAKAEKRFDQVSKVVWSADRRILLIEDNVANVELMRAVMELRPRAKLIVAMKGLLGLELIQKRTPDLVLLDLNLPDIGGKQVLAELRQDPNTAAIPVIVMSADAIESHIAELKAYGIVEYLIKPLDIGRCLRAIDQVFEETQVAER